MAPAAAAAHRWYPARGKDSPAWGRPARPFGIIEPLGTALLIAGFLVVTASAWLGAASLKLRSAADFLLAVYLLGTGTVIVVLLSLSPLDLVTRGGVLLASLAVLVLAAGAWHVRGRPSPPSLRAAARAFAGALRDPALAVLAVAVAGALGYAAALAVATPPNDFDVLWYHLARAAYWRQQHAVGYIQHANDVRLNMNPPGAEILSTWAMTLEGSGRFAGVFQVGALVATMLAIARTGRLLGFGRRAALLGALVFASLPVVALQASTAGNDIVFTSFVVSAVCFMLVDDRTALALGAVALALAVATKGTVLFALPVLLVVAAVLLPRRRWAAVAVAGVVSIAVGGFWYVVNHAEAGSVTPGYEGSNVVEHGSRPIELPAYMARLAIDAVDPAGSVGRDRYLYAIAAAVLLALGLAAAARARSRTAALTGIVAAALALVPLAFARAYDELLRGYQHLLVRGGREGLAFLGWDREPDVPSPFTSWYGPIGLIAFVLAVVLVAREARRGTVRRGALVVTLVPLLYLVVVAATWGYSPWHGRFFIPAVALSATTWGALYRVRPVAWAVTAAASVALVLSLVHYREKPAGFAILGGPTSGRSVWTASRQEIVTSWAARPTGETRLLEEFERRVRPGETVALLLRWDDVSYPFYGAGLDRHVVYVAEGGEGLGADVDWLVVAPGSDAGQCPAGWRRVPFGESGWRLYRRVGTCPDASTSS